MHSTGRVVGALFLTVMIAYTIGVVLLEPILAGPDVLVSASAQRTQVVLGVLLELTNGLAYLGIAVLVYPILRRHHEGVALAYLTIRLMELAMQIVSDVPPLVMVTLGQQYVDAGAPEAWPVEAMGSLLLAVRYWASQMVFLAYAVSAPFFYYGAYRLRLFPRPLALWGLVGAPLVMISVVLEMFGQQPSMLIGLQMGVNEIVLGIWLLVKGFPSSEAPTSPVAQ